MRAIIDINGKQYEVEEGRYVQIDRFSAPENEEVVLGNVCMIIAGEQSLIGSPYVEGATVKTRIKRHSRGPKILVYKMRCKKGYRRKNGHRQDFTELQVELVDFPGRDTIAPLPQKTSEAASEKPTKKASAKATAEAPVEEKPKAKKATTSAGKTTKKSAEATGETASEKKAPKKSSAPKKAQPAAEPTMDASDAGETPQE